MRHGEAVHFREVCATPRNEAPHWSPRALAAFLSGYGFTQSPLHVEVLDGGQDNLNLRVAADGRRFVVRRYDLTAPDEVGFELALVRHLCARGFPTAPLLSRTDGALMAEMDGKPAAVFAFVDGVHPPEGAEAGEQVAAVLARLDLASFDFRHTVVRTRTDANALDRLGLAVRERSAHGSGEPGLATVADDLAWLRLTLEDRLEPNAAALPFGVVHHDPNATNILLDAAGRMIALLDFDEAHMAYLVNDVAALLAYWARDRRTGGMEVQSARRLLSAYQHLRPMLPVEWAVLPWAVLRYFLADAAGYITGRWNADPASQPIMDCNSYRTFRSLRADTAWIQALSLEMG